MIEPLPVYGYHGTRDGAVDSILNDGFRFSRNNEDWLGDGVYFWQDAPARAREWAEKHYGPSIEVAVVASVLRLKDCIDLLDIEWMEELKNIVPTFLDKVGDALPEQKGKAHRLDREFFNFAVDILNKQGLSIKGIRAAFIEDARIMTQSDIFERAHVQIAVLDSAIIEGSWKLKRSS